MLAPTLIPTGAEDLREALRRSRWSPSAAGCTSEHSSHFVPPASIAVRTGREGCTSEHLEFPRSVAARSTATEGSKSEHVSHPAPFLCTTTNNLSRPRPTRKSASEHLPGTAHIELAEQSGLLPQHPLQPVSMWGRAVVFVTVEKGSRRGEGQSSWRRAVVVEKPVTVEKGSRRRSDRPPPTSGTAGASQRAVLLPPRAGRPTVDPQPANSKSRPSHDGVLANSSRGLDTVGGQDLTGVVPSA